MIRSEGNDGDVGVASFGDGLVVGPGVGDDQETRLAEGGLDLISEGSGSETSSHGAAANIPGELENSSLGIWPAGAHIHVLGVLYGSDGSGGQQKLLVGLLQVDDVAAIILLLVDVLFHGLLAVAGPNVGGGSQHLSDVILGNSKG